MNILTTNNPLSNPLLIQTNQTSFTFHYIQMSSTQGKYTWSPSTQGVILGAFYYGYVFTPLLGGRLSELLGAKWLLGGGIFFTSILTLITPYTAELGVGGMVALRVIIGAAQVRYYLFKI